MCKTSKDHASKLHMFPQIGCKMPMYPIDFDSDHLQLIITLTVSFDALHCKKCRLIVETCLYCLFKD